jgi:hypothetical protein
MTVIHTPNPFHQRASDRLLARGYRGGQHRASNAPNPFGIDWHVQHGNTPIVSREQQRIALAAFEAERRQLSGPPPRRGPVGLNDKQ